MMVYVFFFSYLLHMSLNLFNLSIYPHVCVLFAVCVGWAQAIHRNKMFCLLFF